MLTIEAYGAAERAGRRALSNDHIRAFSPVTFLVNGFPVSVEDESEIVRYADTMQELNAPLRHHEIDEYTPYEASLVVAASDCAATASARSSARAIRPWMGPLAAMGMFRAIQAIAAAHDRRRLRVFEIGPGSGYLGTLLVLAGHEYIGTDNTQGFYLWQNRLMEGLRPGNVVEGAAESGWPYERGADVVHMPWWHFAQLHTGGAPEVDLVVCDHALGEMHPYALRYVCQLARLMLERSEIGYVAYGSVGAPQFHSEEAVRLNFDRVGLARPINGAVTLFSRADRSLPEAVRRLAKGAPCVASEPDDGTRLRGADFVRIDWNEAPPSYRLYEFLGYEVPRPTE